MVFEFLNQNQKRISTIINEGAKVSDINFIEALIPEIELMDQDMVESIRGSTFRTVSNLGSLTDFDIPWTEFSDLIVDPANFDPVNINLGDKLEEKFRGLTKTREFLQLKNDRMRFTHAFLGYLKDLQLNFYRGFWGTKIVLAYASVLGQELDRLGVENSQMGIKLAEKDKQIEILNNRVEILKETLKESKKEGLSVTNEVENQDTILKTPENEQETG